MERTDISVIIPTRNRAAWLPKCLAHLEQQTFPAGRFEVIVVDDGSIDDTPSVLERYASGAPVCIRPHRQTAQGLAAARNFAVEKAVGTTLLFLADDELASPRLLELHYATENSNECTACVMGDIHRHPQLPRHTFTRLFLDDPRENRGDDTTHFLEWGRSNFSISRRAFLKSDGFLVNDDLGPAGIFELNFRLSAAGVIPCRIPDARAYVWQPTTFAAERNRQYRLGYGLLELQRLTRASVIPNRFGLAKTRAQRFMDSMAIPSCVRACNRHESEATMLSGRLYKRVLNHDRFCGYQDACQNRPSRPPVTKDPALHTLGAKRA